MFRLQNLCKHHSFLVHHRSHTDATTTIRNVVGYVNFIAFIETKAKIKLLYVEKNKNLREIHRGSGRY
jgi:hypothetical protein